MSSLRHFGAPPPFCVRGPSSNRKVLKVFCIFSSVAKKISPSDIKTEPPSGTSSGAPPPPDLRPRRRPEIPVGRLRWAALPSSVLSVQSFEGGVSHTKYRLGKNTLQPPNPPKPHASLPAFAPELLELVKKACSSLQTHPNRSLAYLRSPPSCSNS